MSGNWYDRFKEIESWAGEQGALESHFVNYIRETTRVAYLPSDAFITGDLCNALLIPRGENPLEIYASSYGTKLLDDIAKLHFDPDPQLFIADSVTNTIDDIEIIEGDDVAGIRLYIINGMLSTPELSERLEQEMFEISIAELTDGWDDGTPDKYLELIRLREYGPKEATEAFGKFMDYGQLTEENLHEFMDLGVDINMMSDGYHVDAGEANAILFAAEYRRVDDMELLLRNGADPKSMVNMLIPGDMNVMYIFLVGHSALYLDIDKDELAELKRGIDLLLKYGVPITVEDIELVEEEFTHGPNKDELLQYMDDHME